MPRSIVAASTVTNDRRKVFARTAPAKNGAPGTKATPRATALTSSASLSTSGGSSTQKNMPPPGICQRHASGPEVGRWATSAACMASRWTR